MHIIINLQKISDKYKISKAVKNVTLCREREKKITADVYQKM